uniref:Uncharacterized protein n=1 Tax=Aegilops tauschii subsp. strangulata TaxID=200361 RepID=A0A453RBD7_AEGTS
IAPVALPDLAPLAFPDLSPLAFPDLAPKCPCLVFKGSLVGRCLCIPEVQGRALASLSLGQRSQRMQRTGRGKKGYSTVATYSLVSSTRVLLVSVFVLSLQ